MYLKLDGNKIMGHAWEQDGEYTEKVSKRPEDIHNFEKGTYAYDYNPLTKEWIPLSNNDMDNHPLKIEKEEGTKFSIVRNLVLDRVALQEVIDHGSVPAGLKTRAQTKLTKVNQELADILGL